MAGRQGEREEESRCERGGGWASGARMRRRVGGAGQVRATPSPTQQVCQGGAGGDHTLGEQQVRRGEAGQVSFRTNAALKQQVTARRVPRARAWHSAEHVDGVWPLARPCGEVGAACHSPRGRSLYHISPHVEVVPDAIARRGQATACCKGATCRRGSTCGPSCATC